MFPFICTDTKKSTETIILYTFISFLNCDSIELIILEGIYASIILKLFFFQNGTMLLDERFKKKGIYFEDGNKKEFFKKEWTNGQYGTETFIDMNRSFYTIMI